MVGLAAVAAATALSACGDGARTPSLGKLPLVPGASVVKTVRVCDAGANAFCAYDLVVVDGHYPSSRALVLAQRDRLRRDGWFGASPDTGVELADESPGHALRVTYATALEDLKGIDLGWIRRPQSIALTLDHALFGRVPTMSVLLETGSR